MTPKFEIFGLKKSLRPKSCRKQWVGCDSIAVNSREEEEELNFSTEINKVPMQVGFGSVSINSETALQVTLTNVIRELMESVTDP